MKKQHTGFALLAVLSLLFVIGASVALLTRPLAEQLKETQRLRRDAQARQIEIARLLEKK